MLLIALLSLKVAIEQFVAIYEEICVLSGMESEVGGREATDACDGWSRLKVSRKGA